MKDLIIKMQELQNLKDHHASCPIPVYTENTSVTQYWRELEEYDNWSVEQHNKINQLETEIIKIELRLIKEKNSI